MRSDICCWILGGSGLKTLETRLMTERPDGFVQWVIRKLPSRLRFTIASAVAKSRDRNTSSSTNLQLTVHLKRNCRLNSKARDR